MLWFFKWALIRPCCGEDVKRKSNSLAKTGVVAWRMCKVSTYYFSLENANFDWQDPLLLNCLDVAEQQRLQRYKHDESRRVFACARILLKTELAKRLVCSAADINFAVAESGKPSLLNDNKLFFSLSHSKKAIAFAIADCNVGIDIEQLDRRGEPWREPDVYLNSDIAQQIFHADADIQRRRFYRYWTAMEAVVKWHGSGIFQVKEQFANQGPIFDTDGLFHIDALNLLTRQAPHLQQMSLVWQGEPGLPEHFVWSNNGFELTDFWLRR